MTDTVQGVALKGTPEELAHQFREEVVGLMLRTISAHTGPVGVHDFLACLVTRLCIDMHDLLGADCAQHLLACLTTALQVRAARTDGATRAH